MSLEKLQARTVRTTITVKSELWLKWLRYKGTLLINQQTELNFTEFANICIDEYFRRKEK